MVIELTDFEFIDQFKPIQNHLDSNAAEGGCMFETYGPELDFVRQTVQAEPNKVWTLLDCDGELIICNGFHFVNRLGYLITENPFEDDKDYLVSDPDYKEFLEEEDED